MDLLSGNTFRLHAEVIHRVKNPANQATVILHLEGPKQHHAASAYNQIMDAAGKIDACIADHRGSKCDLWAVMNEHLRDLKTSCNYDAPDREPKYSASADYHIVFRKWDVLNQLLAEFVKMPNVTISEVKWGLTRDKFGSLEYEALKKALEELPGKAHSAAKKAMACRTGQAESGQPEWRLEPIIINSRPGPTVLALRDLGESNNETKAVEPISPGKRKCSGGVPRMKFLPPEMVVSVRVEGEFEARMDLVSMLAMDKKQE